MIQSFILVGRVQPTLNPSAETLDPSITKTQKSIRIIIPCRCSLVATSLCHGLLELSTTLCSSAHFRYCHTANNKYTHTTFHWLFCSCLLKSLKLLKHVQNFSHLCWHHISSLCPVQSVSNLTRLTRQASPLWSTFPNRLNLIFTLVS